jgi:hypothetical protein
MTILETINNTLGEAKDFVTGNQTAFITGGAGLAVGAALGAGAVALSNRKKSNKRKSSKSKSKRKRSAKRSTGRGAKKRRRNGKSRKTSLRRIHRTKTGQPYIILASGKARFIKKSSARASRKRKGGRY